MAKPMTYGTATGPRSKRPLGKPSTKYQPKQKRARTSYRKRSYVTNTFKLGYPNRKPSFLIEKSVDSPRVGNASQTIYKTYFEYPEVYNSTVHSEITGYRLSERIRLNGVRADIELRNPSSANECYLNIALVTRKDDPQSGLGFTNNFFKDTSADGALDFPVPNTVASTTTPINSDKFHVFWRQQFTLGKLDGTSDIPSRQRFCKYLSINREVRFEDGNANPYLWLVVWANQPLTENTTPVTNVFQYDGILRTYWSEP